MAAELVRRLSQAGVVSRDALARALFDSTQTGVHLLQILAERHAGLVLTLDTELARDKGPSLAGQLAIDFLQVVRLPIGLCKRLLAVPLQVEPTSSRWAIAVADLSDRHVAAEVSFHLGGPVDVFRAPLGTILQAIKSTEERPSGLSDMPLLEVDDEHTPAFGTAAMVPLRRFSARRSIGDAYQEERRPTPRRGLSLPPVQATESQSEPPIPLVRPIPHRGDRLEPTRASVADENLPKDTSKSLVSSQQGQPLSRASTPQETTADVLSELQDLQSPREVLIGFGRAVSAVAKRSAVFAVRAGQFELEYISPGNLARNFSFSAADPSVLNTACQAGYYLGPLTRGAGADVLAEVLDIEADSELYIVPIVVAGRLAAVIVAGLIENTFATTRLIDSIATRVGAILERLVHRRRLAPRIP